MRDNKRPIANSVIVLREEFDDWAILFDPDSGATFGLNPVSVLIWKMLDGSHTVGDITANIKHQCSSVPDDCEEHVSQFLSALEEKGFVGHEKHLTEN
jgi:SynChlorMet cassette protein ScmD